MGTKVDKQILEIREKTLQVEMKRIQREEMILRQKGFDPSKTTGYKADRILRRKK
jgi:hypothetical protein